MKIITGESATNSANDLVMLLNQLKVLKSVTDAKETDEFNLKTDKMVFSNTDTILKFRYGSLMDGHKLDNPEYQKYYKWYNFKTTVYGWVGLTANVPPRFIKNKQRIRYKARDLVYKIRMAIRQSSGSVLSYHNSFNMGLSRYPNVYDEISIINELYDKLTAISADVVEFDDDDLANIVHAKAILKDYNDS